MKNFIEEVLDEHCTTTYNKYTGDEEIISSKEAVLIAMEEYGKQQWNEAIKAAMNFNELLDEKSILKLLK